jgi:electron transfer flavoprotein alpha subunit
VSGSTVVCEARGDDFRPATYELLSQARRLAPAIDGPVIAVVVGEDSPLAPKLDGLADRVVTVSGACLDPYSADPWVEALTAWLETAPDGPPRLLLFGESARTRELLPRLAARLGAWAATNAVDLALEDGRLLLRRPVVGGKAYAVDVVGEGTLLAAFRPHSFAADAPAGLATAMEQAAADPAASRVTLIEREAGAGRRVDLTEAAVVVAGGRGMKGPENFHLLEELAEALEGAVGYSRAVVDAGQAEHAQQVGKSGKTVSPTLYIGAGISGAIHHIMGMDTAKVVVAINSDPQAPIFGQADYGIVGDALLVLPALIEEVRRG